MPMKTHGLFSHSIFLSFHHFLPPFPPSTTFHLRINPSKKQNSNPQKSKRLSKANSNREHADGKPPFPPLPSSRSKLSSPLPQSILPLTTFVSHCLLQPSGQITALVVCTSHAPPLTLLGNIDISPHSLALI